MNAPETDVEGYLVRPEDWTENWANDCAQRLGVQLTDDHWVVIRFMRAFLEDHQVMPDARFVMRHIAATCGAGRNRLFELFPYGYVGQACRIAGMKRPRAWSTG